MENRRRKVEERKWFTPEEKEFVKKKSNCRCSHCDKKLIDDFTVEHVIPLNKGGSNDLSNIVTLCLDCNAKKEDFVYYPLDYYKFLEQNYLEELIDNQEQFYSGFDWVSLKNFLPEDVKELKINISPKGGMISHKGKRLQVKSSILLKKAYYSDLDAIYNFMIKMYSYEGGRYS